MLQWCAPLEGAEARGKLSPIVLLRSSDVVLRSSNGRLCFPDARDGGRLPGVVVPLVEKLAANKGKRGYG